MENIFMRNHKSRHKTMAARFLGISLTVTILQVTESVCPTQCTCNPSTSGQSVTCGSGLNSFPSNIPTNTEIFSIFPVPGQPSSNIPTLSASDFANLKNALRIQIRRSNLQTLSPATFSQLSKLKALDLKDNKLQQISRSVMSGLTALEMIDLTDNYGCQIDHDAFQDLTSLKILRLGGIGLTTVGDILRPLSSLEDLDLHGNRIYLMQTASFTSLNNLKHLDLDFNNLYGIQEGLQQFLTRLRTLRLEYNPWRCNCALKWVKNLPRKFIVPNHAGAGIICAKPANLQFRDIISVADADMKCLPAKITSCSAPVTAKEGDQVVMTCDVEGDPFPQVTWVTPSKANFSHETLLNMTGTVTLTIPTSDYVSHNGLWTVLAESFNTSDSENIDVTIVTTTSTSTTTTTTTAATTTTTTTTTSSSTLPTLPLATTVTQLRISTTGQGSSTTPSSSQSSSSTDTKVITVIAVSAIGGVVCLVGMCLFITVLYRTRTRRRIDDDGRSSWNDDKDIVLYVRTATNASKL